MRANKNSIFYSYAVINRDIILNFYKVTDLNILINIDAFAKYT